MSYKNIQELFNSIDFEKSSKNIKLVLCAAADPNSLEAVFRAHEAKLITPILVGEKKVIEQICSKHNFSLRGIKIYDAIHQNEIVKTSVKLIHDKKAHILMKGKLSSSKILSGVLNKKWGITKNQMISHLSLFDLPEYHKLLGLTDVAMNIAPNLQDKIKIINNSVQFLEKLNIINPKIAAIAAIEGVNERMQATLDAALLSIMNRRGQIKKCIIDGPLAFDNAINTQSKEQKGIQSDVAGDADLLLVPDIEAGNVLYKAFVFFAKAKVAAVVLGAQTPIVLTSRADSQDTKFNSIALAVTALQNS